MYKEINEQPYIINHILNKYIENKKNIIFHGKNQDIKFINLIKKIKHIDLIACGSSWHAALLGKLWIEQISNIPCSVYIASEYRYNKNIVINNSLLILISQSGETADVLEVLRECNKKKLFLNSLSICNVPNSSLINESGFHILTYAKREISVASTKTFLSQLIILLLLSLKISYVRSKKNNDNLLKDIYTLPNIIKEIINTDKQIKKLSFLIKKKKNILFLARQILYPIALEGALKVKELSYIHAEGYPGGELKHGPIALIDKSIPVIFLCKKNYNNLYNKIKINIKEIKSRGGIVYVITDDDINNKFLKNDFINIVDKVVLIPEIKNNLLSPITFLIPIQILSYYIALIKGKDIDKPRNLAKSVTVE